MKQLRRFVFLSAALAVATAAPAQERKAERGAAVPLPVPAWGCRHADLIVRGAIYTDVRGAASPAMAVRDGKVVAVGTNLQITRCAGPHSKVLTLPPGQPIIPGLIDTHTHALDWAKGVLRNEIDLGAPAVRSIADASRLVAERAARARPGQWILGFGWSDSRLAEQRYIRRADLDAVSPDNPVYLVHVSGHLAVANSAALRLAGIARETAEPAGGVIERDERGQPTGILKDNAMALLARLLPRDPADLAERAARLVSDEALRAGLTTIHDFGLTPGDMRGYQAARQSGALRLRVHLVPNVESYAGAESLVARGVATGFGDDRLKLGAAKLFADGGMAARTVAIYPPPVEGEPENFGLLLWSNQELQRTHKLLAAHGWQIATHTIGDRAIDQVLDSYAAVTAELHPRDPRFRIVHCGISTPAIQKRLREMNVLVDGNPPFLYFISKWFERYGAERARWSYPGKSYVENSIIAGGGSDVGVTPLTPWWGIWAGVARQRLGDGVVVAPEERLTVREILTWYTRNGAYIGFEENTKGTLQPGRLADFIVLDRDIFSMPAGELKDVQVLKTFVAGELVYEKKKE